MTDKEIDTIYEYVDSCMRLGEWHVLDKIFGDFDVINMPIDAKVTYLVASFAGKDKIPNRQNFLEKCKFLHKEERLWDNL
jgi:hypothetical protein